MKKIIGLVAIGVLIAALMYTIYRLVIREPEIKSPLPKENGVNVIFITPAGGSPNK
jgi:hypothetical protein